MRKKNDQGQKRTYLNINTNLNKKGKEFSKNSNFS